MAKTKISNLEKKKQELEQKLVSIQNGLDRSIDDVKDGVASNMDPKNLVRKYPLPIVGASILAGFLLGRERKNYNSISSKKYSRSIDRDSGITRELKRLLAKKGMSLLLDFIDNKVSELKQNKPSSDD
jgi:hypothetical protein